MHRTLLSSLFLALTALAAQGPGKPVRDQDLGLSRGPLTDVPSPPAFKDEAAAPGEAPLPRRPNRLAPPVIPHGVADFLPITRTANACVDCHGVPGPKQKGEATPIPASHYADLRRAPETRAANLAGARWVCISCHVPRTDAAPLPGLR